MNFMTNLISKFKKTNKSNDIIEMILPNDAIIKISENLKIVNGYFLILEKPNKSLYLSRYIGFNHDMEKMKSKENFIFFNQENFIFNPTDEIIDNEIKKLVGQAWIISNQSTKQEILNYFNNRSNIYQNEIINNIHKFKQNLAYIFSIITGLFLSSSFISLLEIIPKDFIFNIILPISLISSAIAYLWYTKNVISLENALNEAKDFRLSYDLKTLIENQFRNMIVIMWKNNPATYHFIMDKNEFEIYYKSLYKNQ